MAEAIKFANTQQRILHSARPEQQFDDIRDLLQSTVDQCLAARGYSRFELTEDQRHAIAKLKIGSEARRTFLYRLASDPAVLAAQAKLAKVP